MISVLSLLLIATGTTAQDRAGGASISGHVVNSVSGEPVRKAQLMLRPAAAGPETAPLTAVADAGGRFEFTNVTAGRYRLSVERNGFVRGEYGSRSPNTPGAAITVSAGEELKDLRIRLTPQAVIAGRVLDEDGEATANVQVQAMRFNYSRGRPQLAPVAMTQTNDLGEYRLHGLAPGRYHVSAHYRSWSMMPAAPMPGQGAAPDEESYVPTYYPRTNDPSAAAPLQVGPGDLMGGVDLQLLKIRTVRVSGRVSNLPANPNRRVMVELRPREGYWVTNRTASSVRQDGRFEIRAVAPGSYVLTASVFGPEGTLMARQPVEVGVGDLSDIQLQLTPGLELQGRVRLESGELNMSSLRPYLAPRTQTITYGGAGEPAKEDGSFAIRNIAPDEYTFNLFGVPEGWYIKSIRFGDRETVYTGIDVGAGGTGPIDVLLSPNGAQVEGAVTDNDGQALEGIIVALVPEGDRRSMPHLYRNATTDRSGQFSIRGVPPGEYKLFAWEQVEPGAYLDPSFLQPFESRGERVSLSESGRESKQLKVIPAGQ